MHSAEGPERDTLRNRDAMQSYITGAEQQSNNKTDCCCYHSPMLKTAQFTSYRLIRSYTTPHKASTLNLSRTVALPRSRHLSSSASKLAVTPKMESYKKAGNRKDEAPKHEMVHFPGLMSEKRSFGDFRTVLHTGLYSQIVAMEVPVGGEIGDEVR